MSRLEQPPGSDYQRATVDNGSRSFQAGRDVIINPPGILTDPARESFALDASRVAPPVGDVAVRLRGRDALVDRLTESIHASDGQVHVLAGLGGAGKTTVALFCADQASRMGMAVWWVSATTTSTLLDGLRVVAGCLGGTAGQIDAAWSTLPSAMNLFAQLRSRSEHPALLIIDNVDDPAVLGPPGTRPGDGSGWIRPAPVGSVIITSRQTHRATWGTWHLHHVDSLLPADGAQVLLDLAGDRAGRRPDAERLSQHVGGLPLALHHAGAYLATTAAAAPWPGMIRTFSQYLSALDDGPALFGKSPLGSLPNPDDPRRTITQTWEISLDLLAQHNQPQARNLLRLLACYADAPLPYLDLLEPSMLTTTEQFTGVDSQILPDLLHALAGLALVQLQDPGEQAEHPARWTVTLHPLVRATNMAHPDVAGDPAGYPALAIRLLDALAESDQTGLPEDPSVWPWWQALTPHALHLHSWAHQHQQHLGNDVVTAAARAANLAGRYLHSQGEYGRAATTFQQILDIRIRVQGADHPHTLTTRHALTMVWHAQGKYEQAAATFQQILDTRIRVLGVDHLHTLSTRHNLAMVWHDQGEYGRAATAYQQILDTRIRVLGVDHPHTLSTRHALARVWHAQGKYERAATAYQQILDTRIRVQGVDHPHTLSTRHELAVVWHDQGEYGRAATAYQQILDTRIRVLGENHLHTLTTRHNLAGVWHDQGDHERAATAYQQILDTDMRVQGEDHPHTLTTRHALAVVWQDQGDYERAATAYQQILDTRLRVLGEDHPDTLTTRHNLALVWHAQGHYGRAAAAFQQVLDARVRVLGEDHPRTQATRRAIAALEASNG